MPETDLWVMAELAARDRGWGGDPERAAMLVGLLMLVYANAGISQVHRPPPWWRRRRAASTPSGSDPAVPLS